ncbi:hypothetical protein PHYBOEH_009778 [Phytophthora boehmeriae]|uniref:Calcineurin-like phosphoesterase n=1 Tax=Phytophthora boehmeriae TaxID=109152 RepID=A0A8T1X3W1_9STRA|nr:hypothetical protein PHYBOEH_009778 [Phytophthora boehmeriae]
MERADTKTSALAPSTSAYEANSYSMNGAMRCKDSMLFDDTARPTGPSSSAQNNAVKVVFLTVNDVYAVLPDYDGVGGIAELATMLQSVRQRISADSHVIFTLNGDFLWRSELDRKDKGAHMVELLNYLGVEYVVLGNHEFDFGAEFLMELLTEANFTCFGSNIRSSSNGELLPGITDTCVVPLRNGLRLGLFGVSTTVTAQDPFAGPSVVFEDEVPHASRCVQELKAQGADAIVVLTHFKVADDVHLAMHAPGIDLILGGHDHMPMTCSAGQTLIHKSGIDALWLGVVEMTLTIPAVTEEMKALESSVQVGFQWQMLLNRGYEADPRCSTIINRYACLVEQDEKAQGKLEPLGTVLTALDGRRVTCRTQESNLGNLVADALREGLNADVGLVNAGYIKGDHLNAPGLVVTRKWLEKYLPLVKPTVVVEMPLRELKAALLYWLRRHPVMSSSQPQFSGLRVVYDISQPSAPAISSIHLAKEKYQGDVDESAENQRPGECHEENSGGMDRLVTVAMPLLNTMDGWHFFAGAPQLSSGPIVRNLVEKFVRKRGKVVYAPQEGRLRVITPTLTTLPSHASSL